MSSPSASYPSDNGAAKAPQHNGASGRLLDRLMPDLQSGRLQLALPTDGPKTLNGLILEILEDIPDGDVCVQIGEVKLEVMRSDDQAIRTVKLFRPPVRAKAAKVLRS